MNKEEILAKSKQENRGMDFVNLEASKRSMEVGWVTILVLLAIVIVVNAVTREKMSYDICFAMLAGCGTIFGYKYLKMRKKHELVITVCYALGALGCLVGWILQLIK